MTSKLRFKSTNLARRISEAIAVAIVAVLVVGCATTKPVKTVEVAPPTDPIPMESQAYVRTGEGVKAYPVSRYVDPANPDVMHERHVIYRVERNNTWRLTPPNNRYDMTLLGPVAGVRQPFYKPSPLPAEISRELQKQREITRNMEAQASSSAADSRAAVNEAQAAGQRLAAQQSEIEAAKQAAKKNAEEIAKLKTQVEEGNRKVEPLSPIPKTNTSASPSPSPKSTPAVDEDWMKDKTEKK